MQLAEVGKLLAVIRSFDNRKLDESTAMAWKMMLDRNVPDASLAQATEVVMDWFSTANPYFEVRHLVDGLKREMRLNRAQIANDVRSAKARKIIDPSWSERDPLPWGVANRLAAARMRDRDEAAELGELDSEPGGSWELPKQIGVKHESH